MRLTWRDALATMFVLAGSVLYLVWLANGDVLWMSSVRSVGIAVLLLGLAASVTAVVYGVGAGLLHASKVYLVVTSAIGLSALVAGIWVLTAENETMLGALVVATAILWLASTVRHVLIAQPRHRAQPSRPAFGHA
jgi:hypothetical protein